MIYNLYMIVIVDVLLSDYIVVGSDSGRIVILEYISTKNIFEKVHQETFGKSGCRRIVPGQYLAIDPKGRAVMIGNSKVLCWMCRNTLVCLVVVKCNGLNINMVYFWTTGMLHRSSFFHWRTYCLECWWLASLG
jgi:hypothetical protein